MSSDGSQTHAGASTALRDAEQLSARHVHSLRHEIFHQTKGLKLEGLSQGELGKDYDNILEGSFSNRNYRLETI